MENLYSQPDQANILRKRSDLPNDDSYEKELSTDNSYLSLERLNSTPIYVSSETPALAFSQDLPSNTANAVASSVGEAAIKCRYCDKSCPKEEITSHQDNCEMRKIKCEACEEMVEIDIFDFHLETCTHHEGQYGIYQNFQNYQEYQHGNGGFALEMNHGNIAGEQPAPVESWNQEEEGENLEGQEIEEEEEYDDFDPDTLTYEQLIALDNTIVKKGMTAQEVSKIPVQVYLQEFDGVSSCSVCISDFESGESMRKLPCGHKFHKECIDTWLETNITCPICKKYLR